MKKIICLLLAAVMLICVCSCGSKEVAGDTAEYGRKEDVFNAYSELTEPGAADEGEEKPSVPADAKAEIKEVYGEATPDDGLGAEGYTYDPDPCPPADDPGTPIVIVPGTLTAGEWKDNDNYAFWSGVLARDDWKGFASEWKADLSARFAVTVTDGQNPAKNLPVEILDSEGLPIMSAVTDSYGKAYFYYSLTPYVPAYVLVSGERFDISEADLAAGGISVAGTGRRCTALDLMFTTDTTGSMSDELEYLKKELGNVIERVASENDGLDIRLSVNFYRDEGDEYVVRDFAFSGNAEEVLGQLDLQFSDGGGDYPEAVHTALANSIKEHEWREDAVKLLFLTLDAPGHSESAGVAESIVDSVIAAASEGIRIIPVAASGVDTTTEFMLRMMACVTGGTYIFLTDHSGVGESHLEPTIGDYNVKALNDLMVKVINEYCK